MDPNVPAVLATDGASSLREAIINTNDDAATWPDCTAGSGADENAPAARANPTPGNHTRNLFVAGYLRDYDIHVPVAYDGSTAVPLILDFHGRSSSKEEQKGWSGWNVLAAQSDQRWEQHQIRRQHPDHPHDGAFESRPGPRVTICFRGISNQFFCGNSVGRWHRLIYRFHAIDP